MALTMHVVISGDKEIISKLRKLKQSIFTFERAMKTIGEELTSYFSNQVFASQGGILGERWPALSEKYRIYKATGHTTLNLARQKATTNVNTYPGRGILVKTGEMKNSFVFEADNKSVFITNTSDHFPFHQSNESRSKLPRRVMMKTTPEIRQVVTQIVDDEIKNKIRAAGL